MYRIKARYFKCNSLFLPIQKFFIRVFLFLNGENVSFFLKIHHFGEKLLQIKPTIKHNINYL